MSDNSEVDSGVGKTRPWPHVRTRKRFWNIIFAPANGCESVKAKPRRRTVADHSGQWLVRHWDGSRERNLVSSPPQIKLIGFRPFVHVRLWETGKILNNNCSSVCAVRRRRSPTTTTTAKLYTIPSSDDEAAAIYRQIQIRRRSYWTVISSSCACACVFFHRCHYYYYQERRRQATG